MNRAPLILGTEVYSGNWGIDYTVRELRTIIDHALTNGVTEIDTASSYGNNHFVEKLLGDAIANDRNKFFIGTKFHTNQSGSNIGKPITLISDLERDLIDSLSALKTDYLDIYYFHSGDDELFFQDHIWTFLNEMVKQGLIKKLGLSLNHALVKSGSNKQVTSAKGYGISVVQTVLNMISNEALTFVVPFCKEEGLEVYGRMPLAKGLLTGKYTPSYVFGKNDPRGQNPITTKQILDLMQSKEGIFNVANAIQWALSHVEKIVVGTKNTRQLDGVIQAAVKYI
jgi:aryl-alcohol dehydrogenase-like predicted oxidoreductase